ncbi:MAG: hypothetical protein ACR2NJ_06325, partial [Acidimicrobiales bacterium]
MGAGSPLPAAGWELITEENALAALVERLLSADRYALDTEFHRERTYWPRVAVVQVAWPAVGNAPAGVGLIDAQAVSLGPLGEVLASEAVMVA